MQVVCNGEIYNAPALTQELLARGHRLRTRSDVEVIAHCYEEYGTDVARHLDGMFAFALWDAQGAPARPRHAIASASSRSTSPSGGDRLLWGSEAKCLLAGGRRAGARSTGAPRLPDARLRRRARVDVRGRRAAAAGHDPGRRAADGAPARRRAYWSLAGHVPTSSAGLPRRRCEWGDALVARCEARSQSHLMSDVPLGVFLSGGVDSGTIVALMHELGVAPIRTFTIGFEEKSFSEADTAREVATRYGTEHHELIVRPDAIALLPKLVRHFDEPFADSSAIPVCARLGARAPARDGRAVGRGRRRDARRLRDVPRAQIAALYARLPRAIGAGWCRRSSAGCPCRTRR